MSHPKLAITDHDIHELIRQRWSPRAFDPSRAISQADLLRLFEAARWAPSSFNEQPWRFLVLGRASAPDNWRRLLQTLTPKNQSWAERAPVLVLGVVKTTFEQNDALNPLAWYDAGQAIALLSVQATAIGVSVRQMEGFNRAAARDSLAIPPVFEPAVVIALGYLGDPDTLPIDQHRTAERQPRRRRPIGEFVFEGDWGRNFG